MFSKVNSGGVHGVEGYLVHVEADVCDGLPSFAMVGYLASEVKEAQDRVRSAMKNAGYRLPAKRITVNLSPGDIRKDGTAFDLPIAVSVLVAFGVISEDFLNSSMILGELGLDGSVKPVKGTLSIVSAARSAGIHCCFVPVDNVEEGREIFGIQVVGVETLKQLADYLNCPSTIPQRKESKLVIGTAHAESALDFNEVNGQLLLKRSAEIAVAGNHNLLFLGQAGVGKTMVAKRIPSIMPSLTAEERLEILKVYSVAGMTPPGGAGVLKRPFRSPHHTVSPQALAGGGRIPRPGELSLASGGVLFLDEFPEFQKNTIEILRQPLEEGKITISRLHGIYEFPAHIMLVAAMNPCACGFFPDKNRCSCTESQVNRYLGKISKPLLDRIDICAEAAPVAFDELTQTGDNESSAQIRERVEAARLIQRQRFEQMPILTNSEMGADEVNQFCNLQHSDREFLRKVFVSMNLSPRLYHKILKVARTIADLDGSWEIKHEHLCEAVGFRGLEQKYWR